MGKKNNILCIFIVILFILLSICSCAEKVTSNSDDIHPVSYDGQYTGFLLIVGRPDVVNYNQFFGKRYVHIIVGNGNLIMLMYGAEYISPYQWIPCVGFLRNVQNVEIEDFRGLIVNNFIFGIFYGEWTAN